MPLVGFQFSPPVHGPGRSAGAGGGAGTRVGGRAAPPSRRSSLASQERSQFRKGRRASSSHNSGSHKTDIRAGPRAIAGCGALALVLTVLMAAPDVLSKAASAQAISGGGASHRPGVEGVSCATWLDWRRKDGAIKLFFLPVGDGITAAPRLAPRLPGWDELSRGAWKLGYGKDPSAHDNANLVNEVFRAGLNAWIDGYCRRHRRHDLTRAAGGLARHLSRQR
ncbi:MAG: hypothetical protein V3T02_11470 [Alphaproteobacteria bacterium]